MVNIYEERFTSGGSTLSFIARHSSMKVTTLSVLSMSDDSTAAMNAAGKCALSHSVWYDTSA